MILEGQLGEWSVADLMQILRITRKTASLTIENGRRRGTVHFRDGLIVGADLTPSGQAAGLFERAVETVYVFQTMESGSFSITHDSVPESDVGFDVPEIVESAGVLFSEEQDLIESGLLTARALRLAPQIERNIVISPGEWPAMVAALGRFTFADLEARVGRSQAVAVVSLFRRMGVLEAAFADAIPIQDAAVDHDRRREMRSMVSPADTTLVPGVLSDIRERFRVSEPQPGHAGAS